MLIGEVVQQTGASRDTIRYYERLGLLKTDGRPAQTNKYKAYAPDTPARLNAIQQAKRLGFSLAEIAEGARLYDCHQFSDAEAEAWLLEKLALVEEKMQALQSVRRDLRYTLDQLHGGRCSLRLPHAERPRAAASLASPEMPVRTSARR